MSKLLELAARVESARSEHAAALEAVRAAQELARKTGSELHDATRAWDQATPDIIAALRTHSTQGDQ